MSDTSKDDLLAEGEKHLFSSEFIYIYSELRVLSGSGYAPFSLESIDCKEASCGREGISADKILAGLLKTLRSEEKDEAEGLLNSLGLKPEVFDLKILDEAIGQSLWDRGDAVEMCPNTGFPIKAVYKTHQHVGSQCNCLCAKYGMHNAQVWLDHLVRSEDDKRAKEAAERNDRPPRPHRLVESYDQHFCKFVFETPSNQQEKEDAQIDGLADTVLVKSLQEQIKPISWLGTALNNGDTVVHINDQWPTKECVYIVSYNEAEKVIKITFRGTVSLENWLANLSYGMVMYPNPIKENYEGRTENMGLHKGFSNYLLRKRKDTGKTKIDEILDEVNARGEKVFGKGQYRLVVTGHSLGGSLATIFGLYASADSQLEADPKLPVDVFSFCAPRSGGIQFALAFQNQEKAERLRHFRFFHKKDSVPRLPPFHLGCASGDIYTHVGLGIEIRKMKNKKKKNGKQEQFYCSYGDELSKHRRWVSNRVIESYKKFCGTFSVLADLLTIRVSEHYLPTMLERIHNIQEEMNLDSDQAPGLDSMYKLYVYKKVLNNGVSYSEIEC